MNGRSSYWPALAGGAVVVVAAVLALSAALLPGLAEVDVPTADPGPVPARPAPVPPGASVLFDGTPESLQANWRTADGRPAGWLVQDGVLTVQPGSGSIYTRELFGDVELHVEFATPFPRGERGFHGQGRGNSGVFFFHDRYEVQILDSYENPTYFAGGAGSIYRQSAPAVNASRPPGEWQTYDILFRAPVLASGPDGRVLVKSPGSLMVRHNGILVQDRVPLQGKTTNKLAPVWELHGPTGRIQLQEHANPVRFRNVWVRELDKAGR